MAKEPVAGHVKTRLARDVGVVLATSLYRAMLSDLTGRLSRDVRWQTTLAVSPASALNSRAFPNASRCGQGTGDLGQRLAFVVRHAPPGPVVVIGADSPSITPAAIACAFRALAGRDAVFGPSLDGGYWLVGIAHRARSLPVFQCVRWSSQHTLADTRRNLTDRSVATIEARGDVDDAAGLSALRDSIGRRVLPRSSAKQ